MARDLALLWLRGWGAPEGRRSLNAPAASYEEACPAMVVGLDGVETVPQLRAELRRLRDDGTLARTAAALGLGSAPQPAAATPAPAARGLGWGSAAQPAAAAPAAGEGGADYIGIHRSSPGKYSARLWLRLDG